MKDKKHPNKYRTLSILIAICLLFAIMQALRPQLENPPVEADFQGPEKVTSILRGSCYDCHSNETRLKWFDYIQPAYGKVVKDVTAGRAGLNFSQWGLMTLTERKGKLFEILNQIELGSMPPGQYLAVHSSAKISPSELKVLRNYVAGLIVNKVSDSVSRLEAQRQFLKWGKQTARKRNIPITITGVPYFPEYRDWQVINIIDRLDNNSLRIIFGNSVAARAAMENDTNPWPDGTILAKVMWDRLKDSNEKISAGTFKQVEFMIKNKRYASTAGWGWARFKTMDLVPYGKNVGYATECVNCHTPVKKYDFVFTKAIKF